MKKLLLAFSFLFTGTAIAQSPQFLNYQGVARDASGTVINSGNIGIRFEIWRTSPTGTKVYQEEMSAVPSAAGIFTTAIGSGSNTTVGPFSSINWANGPYFIVVGIDPIGGTSFSTVGTSQLLSVPYALYAETAGNATTFAAGNGITISSGTIINSAPDKTVGISPSGITNVLGTYPNYTVDVAAPTLNYNSGTQVLTLTQGSAITTATITGAASGTVSMFAAGIASVTPAGPGSNFTVSVQTPSFTGAGSTTVTGTYPNYIISTPGPSTLAATSTNIQINPPHATNTISPGNYSINIVPTTISGPNVIGTYPNYTVGAGSNPNIIGQGVTTVTTAGNNYTVATPPANMTFTPATGLLSYSPAIGTNTVNISPSLTFASGVLTAGSNTVLIPGVGLWARPTTTATFLSNANDNVGIGINSPAQQLHIFSPGINVGVAIDAGAVAGRSRLGFLAGGVDNGEIGFKNNLTFGSIANSSLIMGTEFMRITNSGKVGIGTNSPGALLELFSSSSSGLLNLKTNLANTQITMDDGAASDVYLTTTNGVFDVWTSGAQKLTVDLAGFVGIGQTSPTAKLNLYGTNTTTFVSAFSASPESAIRVHNNDLTQNNFSSLIFSTQASNFSNFEAAKIVGVNSNHTAGSIGGDLVFMTRDPATISERMRIVSNGNVGIRTANPAADLDVNGYTKLGPNSPALQTIKLIGTTATTQGGAVSIPIPAFVNTAKILSISVMVVWSATPGDWIQPGWTSSAGYNFNWNVNGNNLFVTNVPTNSGNILSKPIQVLITYEQ